MLAQSQARKIAMACFAFAVMFIIFGCEMMNIELSEETSPENDKFLVRKKSSNEDIVKKTSPVSPTPKIVVPLPKKKEVPATRPVAKVVEPSPFSERKLLPENSATIELAVDNKNDFSNLSGIIEKTKKNEPEIKAPKVKIGTDFNPLLDFSKSILNANKDTSKDKLIRDGYKQLQKQYTYGTRNRQFLDLMYARFLSDRQDTRALKILDDVQRQIRFSLPLQAKNVTFIKAIKAYGDFEKESKFYAYDEWVYVYGELMNFVNAPDGDEFLSEIEVSATILNAKGEIIKSIPASRMTRNSRSQLNDFHFIFKFRNQQREMKAGEKYTLRILVKDLQADKSKKVASITTEKELHFNVQ